MQKTKLGVLGNYFQYHLFKIAPNNEFYKEVEREYNNCFANYKYAIGLIENKTRTCLHICCLTNDDKFDFSSFQFYLNQLPNLDLHSVAFLFALTYNIESRLINNAFQTPENYPSEFAKSFLKDTFGQVVFAFQFTELLRVCLPKEENSHNQINEYRRLYNLREANFYKKLQDLYLPDGYSLYKLLEAYTPCNTKSNDFGFLISPTYKLAYTFIQSAKKYLPE